MMIIKRIWAMPNKWTFTIKPIVELLNRYVIDPEQWIDPFAGENSPASITNDINSDRPTQYHLDALTFLKSYASNSIKGILLDPPYSLRQLKECYDGIGRALTQRESQKFFSDIYDEAARIVAPGGLILNFGWNSGGVGMKRGFEIIEILLVPHGYMHNDTIVTVERKS